MVRLIEDPKINGCQADTDLVAVVATQATPT